MCSKAICVCCISSGARRVVVSVYATQQVRHRTIECDVLRTDFISQ